MRGQVGGRVGAGVVMEDDVEVGPEDAAVGDFAEVAEDSEDSEDPEDSEDSEDFEDSEDDAGAGAGHRKIGEDQARSSFSDRHSSLASV